MDSRQRERCDLMIIQPEWGTRNVNKYFYESEARRILWRCGTDCGRNADAGMAVRVGGMYGRKRTFRYPKSYGSGSKAAGTAAPSVGRKSPRQGAKAAFDGRNGCQKCFCVTFRK